MDSASATNTTISPENSANSNSLVALEFQTVELQQVKEKLQAKLSKKCLHNIVAALQQELTSEREKIAELKINEELLQIKKNALINRHLEVIEYYNYEIERILAGISESESLLVEYSNHKNHNDDYYTHYKSAIHNANSVSYSNSVNKIKHNVVSYLINKERTLVTQKLKLKERIKGYANKMIDNFHGLVAVSTKQLECNALIYHIQLASKELIGKNTVPPKVLVDNIMNNIKVHCVLINALQFVEIVASYNWRKLSTSSKGLKLNTVDAYQKLLYLLPPICSCAFAVVRNWSQDPELLIAISSYLFPSLNSLLKAKDALYEYDQLQAKHNASNSSIRAASPSSRPQSPMQCVGSPNINRKSLPVVKSRGKSPPQRGRNVRSSLAISKPEAVKQEQLLQWSWGDSYDENTLISDVILWLKAFRFARQFKFHSYTEICCCLGSVAQFDFTKREENNLSSKKYYQIINDSKFTNSDGNSDKNKNSSNYKQGNKYEKKSVLHSDLYKDSFRKDSSANDGDKQLMTEVLRKFSQYLFNGSSMSYHLLSIANSLFCTLSKKPLDEIETELLQYRKKKNLPKIMGTIAHELISTAVAYGQVCISKNAVRLGSASSPVAFGVNDYYYFTELDKECIASLKCTCSLYSAGIMELEGIVILKDCLQLLSVRVGSFLLASSYVECVAAAASCCMVADGTPTARDLRKLSQRRGTIIDEFAESKQKETDERRAKALKRSNTQGPTQLPTIQDITRSSASKGKNPDMKYIHGKAISSTSRKITFKVDDAENQDFLEAHNLKIKAEVRNTMLIGREGVNRKIGDKANTNGETHVLLKEMPYHPAKKPDTMQVLGDSTLLLISIVGHHRNSLTICHTSLLALRILLRTSFLSIERMEEILPTVIGSIITPLVTEKGDESDEEDDDYLELLNANASFQGSSMDSVSTASTASFDSGGIDQQSSVLAVPEENLPGLTAPPKDTDSNDGSVPTSPAEGTRKKEKALPPDEIVRNWKYSNIPNLLCTYAGSNISAAKASLSITFAELLAYIGDTHIQCSEVVEQLLLLCQQLCNTSRLCKLTLVEARLPAILQRMLENCIINDVYIVALCEICVELLFVGA